jgi:hypothetical protein
MTEPDETLDSFEAVVREQTDVGIEQAGVSKESHESELMDSFLFELDLDGYVDDFNRRVLVGVVAGANHGVVRWI